MVVILISGLAVWVQSQFVEEPTFWLTVLHVLLNAILLTFVVMPFFIVHRRLLLSSKKWLSRWSGVAIEFIFYIQVVIGLYLLLLGDTDGLEASALWLHLNLSLLFISFIVLHLVLVKILSKRAH